MNGYIDKNDEFVNVRKGRLQEGYLFFGLVDRMYRNYVMFVCLFIFCFFLLIKDNEC